MLIVNFLEKEMEKTDEYLISFFFNKAMAQMKSDMGQKKKANRPMFFF